MIQAHTLRMTAKNQTEDEHTSILLHDHLQKNKHHAKTPQIKTSIGHIGERDFGYAADREEGEKAHLNLLAFRRTMHRMPTRRGSSPAAH